MGTDLMRSELSSKCSVGDMWCTSLFATTGSGIAVSCQC